MKHVLDLVKPGRGTWLAGCTCGHTYMAGQSRYWTPGEISNARIRQMHRNHKAES